MRRKSIEYIVGEDLENLDIWFTSNKVLIDFASGYAFTLAVTDINGTIQFEKTDNITGDTGTGTETSGSPNVIIEWDTSGDLNALAAGRYVAELTALQVASGKARRRQFYLDMVQSYS